MSNDTSARLRGHCPRCGADRWADVIARHKEEWSEPEIAVWVATEFRILKCRGCEVVYIQKHQSGSEYYSLEENPFTGEQDTVERPFVTHWPIPTRRKKPDWLSENILGLSRLTDPDLQRLLGEVYSALDSELSVLAAIGIRTSFDRASELLGIDPERTFNEKLAALQMGGHIGTKEQEILTALTDAGSAAAHRGWRPSSQELGTMMEIIEGFLHRSFILDSEAKKLKTMVPKRVNKPPA